MAQTRAVRTTAAFVVSCLGLLACVEQTEAQWLQWGGPTRDFKVEASELADEWPPDGPRKIWHRPLGTGYSSIVADDGVLYTMYRKKKSDAYEYTIALSAKTGETIWQKRDMAVVPSSVPEHGKMHTGPNATPLIVGDRLFTVGRNALLTCRQKSDGKMLWKHNLVKELGAETQACGFSSSPLAYKGTVILPLGRAEGEQREGNSLVAFDQETGDVLWHRHTFRIAHSSPILIKFNGQDQLVQCTDRALIGVNPDNGNLYWELVHADPEQLGGAMATPVWNGKDTIMFSGHQLGAAAKLTSDKGETSAELLWSTNKARLGTSNPILAGDLLVGSKLAREGPLLGQDPHTGERLWVDRAFPQAALIAAGDRLIMLDHNGQLTLATVTREGVTVHSRCQMTETESFTAPTLVGTTLYVRDEKNMMALDLARSDTDRAG